MGEVIPATDVRAVTESILDVRASVPRDRAALVAVSGIDGCGKGWLTRQIVDELQARGVNAANINIDGWLNLPDKRFSDKNPAEHFYLHAIRFDEMFAPLVLPLRDHRSVSVEADFAEETAMTYRKHTYEFADIDVIVLEGIYLLKQAFRVQILRPFDMDRLQLREGVGAGPFPRPRGVAAGRNDSRLRDDLFPRTENPFPARRSEKRRNDHRRQQLEGDFGLDR